MKKLLILIVLALSLVATHTLAQEAAPTIDVTGSDALVKEKGRFKDTWVGPEADFTRYNKLYVWVAELQFREVKARPAEASGRIDDESEFALSQEEQEKYRQVVTEALVDELGHSKKLQPVDDLRSDTLIVRASILDIVCHVPPTSTSDVDVYPSTVGAGTLRFELIDSETGVIQARLEERSRVLPSGGIKYETSPKPVYRLTM